MNLRQVHPCFHNILHSNPLVDSTTPCHPRTAVGMTAKEVIHVICLTHKSRNHGGLHQVLCHEIKCVCTAPVYKDLIPIDLQLGHGNNPAIHIGGALHGGLPCHLLCPWVDVVQSLMTDSGQGISSNSFPMGSNETSKDPVVFEGLNIFC